MRCLMAPPEMLFRGARVILEALFFFKLLRSFAKQVIKLSVKSKGVYKKLVKFA